MNLKAISLACVVGLSTLVFTGCGNDNGNNNNGNNTGNTGTSTSMNARSANRGTAIDPLTGTRTGTSFDRTNAGRYGSAIDDNARGNNRLFGNNDGRLDMNDNRGGLFGTGIGNGIDEGSGTSRDYRGGLFNTGIGNGIDENNIDGTGMLGNGANDNRGGLFGTGLFSGMMHNDDNVHRRNGNELGNGKAGRAGTGMNGIRSNGAGTSDSMNRFGGLNANGIQGYGVNGTTGLYGNGTTAFNDALVLGNFVIVGKNGNGNNGRGAGASTQVGATAGSGSQHILQVTNPQALQALERVKRQLETNIPGQDTGKLAKDLALVLKHAKEPAAQAGNGMATGGRAAAGR